MENILVKKFQIVFVILTGKLDFAWDFKKRKVKKELNPKIVLLFEVILVVFILILSLIAWVLYLFVAVANIRHRILQMKNRTL